jgi:hypothetical protein
MLQYIFGSDFSCMNTAKGVHIKLDKKTLHTKAKLAILTTN